MPEGSKTEHDKKTDELTERIHGVPVDEPGAMIKPSSTSSQKATAEPPASGSEQHKVSTVTGAHVDAYDKRVWTKKGKFRPGRNLFKSIVFVLAALVVLGGGYFAFTKLTDKPYTYKELSSYSLPGQKNGNGMSFKYPSDMSATFTSDQSVIFKHSDDDDNKVSSLVAFAQPAGKITKKVKDRIAKAYKSNELQSLVTTAGIEASEFKIVNKHVNTNEDRYTFTISYTSDIYRDDEAKTRVLGRVIILLGDETLYGLQYNAVKKVYQHNRATMQKVENSIKIDR